MNENLIERVFALFQRTTPDNLSIAMAVHKHSADFCKELLSRLLLPAPDGEIYQEVVSELERRIAQVGENFPITGKLPIFHDLPATAFINWLARPERTDDEKAQTKTLMYAALLFETKRAGVPLSQVAPDPELAQAINEYTQFASQFPQLKQESKQQSISMGEISAQLGIVGGDIQNAKQAIEQLTFDRAALEAEVVKAGAKLSALQTAIEDAEKQITQEIENSIAKAGERIDQFVASVQAKSEFETLKLYWYKRAQRARNSLLSAWIVLAILLVSPLAIVIFRYDDLLLALGNFASAEPLKLPTGFGPAAATVATISHLILVTIPVALYFWLIRLVVRFQMRSMLLMDDASNRATVLDTYYKMIADGKATTDDRALILAALCRPSPGHGGDNVDPPPFTDLVSKAMGNTA